MPSNNNIFTVSAAGTGKTTLIVKTAYEAGEPTLVTTFTNNGCEEIKKKFIEEYGVIPAWVTIQSWYQFLLSQLVRPYQSVLYEKRVSTIFFPENSQRFFMARMRIPETNTKAYYFVGDDKLIDRHAAKFAVKANQAARGKVFTRLSKLYKHIMIDEVQDLAGWDLNVVEELLKSDVQVFAVGDPRQCTYSTNHSPKNRGKNGVNVLRFFEDQEAQGRIQITTSDKTYRCNKKICDFANLLYPDMPLMESAYPEQNGDGVFYIKTDQAKQFYDNEKPQVLRWDKRTNTLGLPASNFGDVKGLTFENVLIFPTPYIKTHLQGNAIDRSKLLALSKYYVAVTRARRKVVFVYDGSDDLIISTLQEVTNAQD